MLPAQSHNLGTAQMLDALALVAPGRLRGRARHPEEVAGGSMCQDNLCFRLASWRQLVNRSLRGASGCSATVRSLLDKLGGHSFERSLQSVFSAAVGIGRSRCPRRPCPVAQRTLARPHNEGSCHLRKNLRRIARPIRLPGQAPSVPRRRKDDSLVDPSVCNRGPGPEQATQGRS